MFQQPAKGVLGGGKAEASGLLIQIGGLGLILIHALSHHIQIGQRKDGLNLAVVGVLLQHRQGRFVILQA